MRSELSYHKVEAFKCSDGQSFDKELGALRWQTILNIQSTIGVGNIDPAIHLKVCEQIVSMRDTVAQMLLDYSNKSRALSEGSSKA